MSFFADLLAVLNFRSGRKKQKLEITPLEQHLTQIHKPKDLAEIEKYDQKIRQLLDRITPRGPAWEPANEKNYAHRLAEARHVAAEISILLDEMMRLIYSK